MSSAPKSRTNLRRLLGITRDSLEIDVPHVGYALGVDIERAGSSIDKHITPGAG